MCTTVLSKDFNKLQINGFITMSVSKDKLHESCTEGKEVVKRARKEVVVIEEFL